MRTLEPARVHRAPKRSITFARIFSAALGVASLLAASDVAAQVSTFSLDRLRIGGAPDDGVGVWRPQMGESTRLYGQLALGFALHPFRLENELDPARERAAAGKLATPVTTEVITYASAGVEILDRLSLQVELPIIVGQSANATNDADVGANDAASPRVAAPMDTRLTVRAILFRNATRSFKLGIDGSLWVPTGDRLSYAGDGSASGAVSLAAEANFGRGFVVANTGVHVRRAFALDDFRGGSEWTYAIGGFVPLQGDSIRLGAELFGSIAMNQGATFRQNDPLEWLAEARLHVDKKKQGYVGVAGGTRLFPGYSPDFRALLLVGYSFPIHDTDPPSPHRKFHAKGGPCPDADHDGICDDVDLCPLDPEDHLPPDPDDGCPAMPDDDHDGIPNALDACPNAPGPPSDIPEKNGCPIWITPPKKGGEQIVVLLKPIEFETAKSTILPRSFPILDEVKGFIGANPNVKIAIEGHTDNRGPDPLNEKLSDDRAHSVMRYLIEHGISADRLSAKGFGPHRPITDNATAEGRQKNRRVDFRLVD